MDAVAICPSEPCMLSTKHGSWEPQESNLSPRPFQGRAPPAELGTQHLLYVSVCRGPPVHGAGWRNRTPVNCLQDSRTATVLNRRYLQMCGGRSIQSDPSQLLDHHHNVPPAGLEPATFRLRVGSSDQLSYKGLRNLFKYALFKGAHSSHRQFLFPIKPSPCLTLCCSALLFMWHGLQRRSHFWISSTSLSQERVNLALMAKTFSLGSL